MDLDKYTERSRGFIQAAQEARNGGRHAARSRLRGEGPMLRRHYRGLSTAGPAKMVNASFITDRRLDTSHDVS